MKDHLGNVRASFTCASGAPVMQQEDYYYPFGLSFRMQDAASANRYLYNGKEKEDFHNLGWNDYSARFYDPQLGRWYSVDPLASKYPGWSPYNYCAGNPLVYIDPTGKNWFYYQAEGEDNPSWHWKEGRKTTYKNKAGETETIYSNYVYLVIYRIFEKNEHGAALGTLTLYGNGFNDVIVQSNGVFSGGNDYESITEGNRFMNLSRRERGLEAELDQNGDVNTVPNDGLQYFPNPVIRIDNHLYNVGAAWGSGRIHLKSDSFKDNKYLHGEGKYFGWTQGCVCDRSEQIFYYFNSHPEINGIVPFYTVKYKQ